MQREKLYNDFKHKYKSSNNAFLNEWMFIFIPCI
jgi:hypothetical protein